MDIIDPIDITDAMLLSSNVPENDYPVYDAGYVYAQGDLVIDTSVGVHKIFEQAQGVSHVVTIAVPSGYISWTGHGQVEDKPLRFDSTGSLPSPLVEGTTYYVKDPDANGFYLSTSPSSGASITTSGAQSGVHTIVCNEIGKNPSAQPTYWTAGTATNRWKIFDRYNATVTENPSSIEFSLRTGGLYGGLYFAGLDADEIEITITDDVEGEVYNKTFTLIQSNSGSSFYNWGFQPIIRKQTFSLVDFPRYHNSTANIAIRRDGVAKCAMVIIGPTTYVADTEWGYGTSYKDYSTVTFTADGDMNIVLRPWTRSLSIPLSVKTGDATDSSFETLIKFRQKLVVFVASKNIRMGSLYARMVGLRTVVPGRAYSQLSLDVDGGT